MSEINVTPLVDVMLVLLIVFMVSAPLLTVGVPVDLPESRANALPPSQEEPLTVTVGADGEVYLQKTPVALEELAPKLRAILENRSDDRIFLRGDAGVEYGRIMKVMGTLNGSGFRKIGLVSEPET